MQPRQICDRITRDHRGLRDRLGRVKALSHVALEGSSGSDALRAEAHELLHALEQHMRFEDEHLLPVLAAGGARGPERMEHIRRDHHEQRELLRYAAGVVDDPTRALELIARTTLDLVRLLDDDMQDEERLLRDVLREASVGVNVEAR
jgi:iron-sulfur cluster repair protein YtfE (RIC family)